MLLAAESFLPPLLSLSCLALALGSSLCGTMVASHGNPSCCVAQLISPMRTKVLAGTAYNSIEFD